MKNTKKSKTNLNFLTVLILLVVDFVLIFALVFLFGDLPKKAAEIKNLRSLKLSQNVDVERLSAEVKASEQSYQELLKYYPDDESFIEFVAELDNLKRDGYLGAFMFREEEPVRDKVGYAGIPIEMEIVGNKDTLREALLRLNSLPYVIRPVTVEITKATAEEGNYNLRYGGFLYTNEEFNSN